MIFSIVVPFYNSLPYFDVMLKSLFSQIDDDVEVVFVNDGSTDNSMSALQKYESYHNIKIISIPNGGVSKARNIGFNACTGDYVWFADSDDVIGTFAISKIKKKFKSLEFKPDIITANYYAFDDEVKNKGILYKNDNYYNEYEDTNGIIDDPFDVLFNRKNNCTMIWNTIFRSEHLREHCIKFVEELVFAEGLVFKIKAIANAKKFSFMNSYIYGYRVPDAKRGSLSMQHHSINETIFLINALEEWYYCFEKECHFKSGSDFMKLYLAQLIGDLLNYVDFLLKNEKNKNEYNEYNEYLSTKSNSFEHIKRNITKRPSPKGEGLEG